MSFDLSLKDCEKAIELDPKFIKAYLRKANAQKGESVRRNAVHIFILSKGASINDIRQIFRFLTSSPLSTFGFDL